MLRSLASKPSSSISIRSRAILAVFRVIRPPLITSAKSRTRFKSRLAIRGVPRDREAISNAASASMSAPKIWALRVTIFPSSWGE